MDWGDFAINNKNHDYKLLPEFLTAAPYLKQYMTNAVAVRTSYRIVLESIFTSQLALLALVILQLAKVAISILKLDFNEIGNLVDLFVDSVTELAESPGDILNVLENGSLPTGGFSGASDDDATGSVLETLNDKLGREAHLENRTKNP
ncbi:hypothetical protein GN244_ATG07225 [Phytophthora infestans]|uniref:Uncharacterized protein n=1 Tax=Phytophthora infestans TaxID=4787 RepID=A0A833WWV9_PHYIN|nr:hypothetical protein GN244_ATG07225 [Phytophthora infestans]